MQVEKYADGGAGFQPHSDTSKEAAHSNRITGKAQATALLAWMEKRYSQGATIDEAAVYLSETLLRTIPPGTASARFIALERDGHIIKTTLRRLTRTGHDAYVYLVKDAFLAFQGQGGVHAAPVRKAKKIQRTAPQSPAPKRPSKASSAAVKLAQQDLFGPLP